MSPECRPKVEAVCDAQREVLAALVELRRALARVQSSDVVVLLEEVDEAADEAAALYSRLADGYVAALGVEGKKRGRR